MERGLDELARARSLGIDGDLLRDHEVPHLEDALREAGQACTPRDGDWECGPVSPLADERSAAGARRSAVQGQ